MILTKYMVKQIFINQIIVLILLFLVCICQKLIKVLGLEYNISVYLIISYLLLNIPELGKLLIPFSLFLSVIITCCQLHIHNEVLAMYACGISKYILVQSILLCSVVILCIAFINLSWLSPYCCQNQNYVLSKLKKNVYSNIYVDRKFQFFFNKHVILFVDKINQKELQHVFLISKKKYDHINTVSIITADKGNIYNNFNDLRSIILDKGTYYEIHNDQKMCTDICITNFFRYQMLIDCNFELQQKTHEIFDYMSMKQLWTSSIEGAYAEFNWRLTLLVSIFIMPLIALVLIINISYQYSLSFLLSMILYIIFFLSHILLRFYNILFSMNSIFWSWLINFIYLILIFLFFFQENFILRVFRKRFF